jgi:predicted NAD-dependent protein-ADP-ribosyltransferase YbiA (DUF1768 family)
MDESYPYTAEVSSQISEFYRKRNKKPYEYIYTENGDLIYGKVVIPLKRYVGMTPEERAAQEQERIEKLIRIEAEIEKKKSILRGALENFKENGEISQVLFYNKQIQSLDSQRSYVRSQERFFTYIYNPPTNEILLDQPREKRKLFTIADFFGGALGPTVVKLNLSDFSPLFFYGKYVDEETGDTESIELNVGRSLLEDGQIARFFYDTEEISPLRDVTFTMNDTEYSSAIQAYEVERVKELQATGSASLGDILSKLMKTRSVRTVRLIMKSVKEQVADPEELWFNVMSNMYLQNEDLKTILLATGSDILAYQDPTSGLYGIGVGLNEETRLNINNWLGENIVGRALDRLRLQLREGGLEEETAVPGAAAKRVITADEQAAAKLGAIIKARRA